VIEQSLHPFGWEVNTQAPIGLLIDGPWGIALQELIGKSSREWVIVTDNPCPEYWEDLWDYSPRGLLAGGHCVEELANALSQASAGESFRRTPFHNRSLTYIERRLMHYSAQGWENRRIALKLNLNEGTVRNGLSRVFHKLGFENRTQMALYYWGLWHLLDSQLADGEKLDTV
jgi:DNA-binding NarL/FixJ family response regulator